MSTKILYTIVATTLLTSAATLSLKDVTALAEHNTTLSQALHEEYLSQKAESMAALSQPIELFGSVAQANPATGKDETEYSLGFSKPLYLGSALQEEEKIAVLQTQMVQIAGEKDEIALTHTVQNLYHQHCIDKSRAVSFRDAYREFVTLYSKQEKAYQLHEISKVELLQLRMEREQLHAEQKEAEMRQRASEAYLLGVLGQRSEKTELACNDMISPETLPDTASSQFTLTKAYHYKALQQAKTTVERYDTLFDSVTLSAQYDKEIDMERAGIGFSIPLHFSSDRYERKQLAAMHQSNAITHRQHYEMQIASQQYRTGVAELKGKLLTLHTTAESLETYQKELFPMIEKSYRLGESSLIELLLTKQRYRTLQHTYYETQKSYFHLLFSLLTLTEQKDYQ